MKIYIILNSSLGMKSGKLVSQGAHAASHVTEILIRERPNEWKLYKRSGSPKIALKAPEDTLLSLIDKFSPRIYPIYDAGHTQVPAGSLTALGYFSPDDEAPEEIQKLKLL